MDRKLFDITRGGEDNRLLPFFWLHGDDQDKFASELDKIQEAGIRAICLESRPHPDFCGDRWWSDLDMIMGEAKKRGMKVWVLDDRHYPTGIANGMVAKKYPERRKWHMVEKHIDVTGPLTGAILVHGDEENAVVKNRQLLAAVAYRRQGPEEKMTAPGIDLTDNVKGDLLYWDVPDGCWRVYLIFISREGAAGHMADYIHMIDPDSVDVLINEVYEPHYQHYGDEFGKTFAGFFSDEPAIGNSFLRGVPVGGYDYSIGLQLMALPWRSDMPEMFEKRLGPDWKMLLPGLWRPLEGSTAKVRLAYMDILTGLYRDCFAMRVGNWCRARGVEYIGHVIEDMNCHGRLGSGTGHYFRALEGQDMAGIDVVLHQIIPGRAHYDHNSRAGYGSVDATFYHYMLGKLGTSLAYLAPHMRGRTMCEIFGAYGWAEGVPMMKWLMDHMLVRGVNHFVPHAFDTHFPLEDCPPHFYARGNNPQFRDFALLMRYVNRVSHLLTDGSILPDAGVFYHAEAEWAGDNYMLSEHPAKALLDAQLDYVFVPSDVLVNATLNESGELVLGQLGSGAAKAEGSRNDRRNGGQAPVPGGQFSGRNGGQVPVSGETTAEIEAENGACPPFQTAENRAETGACPPFQEPFKKPLTIPCLILPEAGTLPEPVMNKLRELSAAGFPIAFVNSVTARSDVGPSTLPDSVPALPLGDIPEFVRGTSRHGTVSVTPEFPLLRVFRYERGGSTYFMVFNEDMRSFDGALTLPLGGDCGSGNDSGAGSGNCHPQAAKLDLLYMRYEKIDLDLELSRVGGNSVTLPLALSPYESCIFAFGDRVVDALGADGTQLTRIDPRPLACQEATPGIRVIDIQHFDIARCPSADYPNFAGIAADSPLFDITGPDGDNRFCGYIRYEAEFEARGGEKLAEIDLGRVGETAHVSVNGVNIGCAICPPYRIRPVDSTDPSASGALALRDGVNTVTIEVANSVAYRQRDKFSVELMLTASGLLGPVKLVVERP